MARQLIRYCCPHSNASRYSYQLSKVYGQPEAVVGTFDCDCGFSYVRKGPDKTSQDGVRFNRVKTYGSLWEEALIRLWKDTSISTAGIARELCTSLKTVKYQAVRLGLKFPRSGPGPKVTQAKPNLSKRLRRSKTQLESYRNEWLSAIKHNPGATRSFLQQRPFRRIYRWLYKNDREWLVAHLPEKRSAGGSNRHVDWLKRDTSLAKEVRLSATKLRKTGGKPTQITIAAISRDLGCESLNQKRVYLPRLPLTFRALAEVTETHVDFCIRKVQWVTACFRQEHRAPAWSQIPIRVGLSWRSVYIPEVKTAIDFAWQSLQNLKGKDVSAVA